MRPTKHSLAFTAIVFLCLPAHEEPVCMAAPGESAAAEILYTPTEEEIRAEYQRDLTNQKLQTWREYWGWVQGFYKGNFCADGWTKHSQTTLNAVKVEEARPTILKKLNRLGRLISQEWAKHASVRKITSTDLRRWNDAIAEARRSDDGTGQGIKRALDKIREQAQRQLAG